MNTFRKDTPRATPLASLPPRPSAPPSKGTALVGAVLLLTGSGDYHLAAGKAIVLGRDASCDLVLNDPLASRHHMQIVASKDHVVLEDFKSTNGVYVNGIRVQHSTRLHAGDRILLGTTELSVFSADGPQTISPRERNAPDLRHARCLALQLGWLILKTRSRSDYGLPL